MKKTFLIIIIFLSFIVAPLVVSAVELEQTYPVLGTKSITEDSSLTELISYVITLAIILAILIVIVNLIVAGIQYLTSSGKPNAMQDAKDRITKAFLGLAILTASYLILATVNPQLTVLQVDFVPFDSALFLFTKDGYDAFIKENGLSVMNNLMEQKKIYPITHDIKDMQDEAEMGKLMAEKCEGQNLLGLQELPCTSAEIVNFSNIPIYAIGFLGELEQESRIIMYSQENFEGEKKEYVFYGKLNKYETINKLKPNVSQHSMQLRILGKDFTPNAVDPELNNFDFFKTDPSAFKVNYVNVTRYMYDELLIDMQRDKIELDFETALGTGVGTPIYVVGKNDNNPAFNDLVYPPLSLQVRRKNPGIYLYTGVTNSDEERIFVESEDDLGRRSIDFLKAEKVKIINEKTIFDENLNKIDIPLEERNDYLTILYEDTHQVGNLRIFFEQRLDTTESIPKMCSSGKPAITDASGNTISCGFEVFDLVSESALEDHVAKFSYYEASGPFQLEIGNTGDLGVMNDPSDDIATEDMLVDIDVIINLSDSAEVKTEKAKYGAVDSVSSIGIYELSNDNSACKEISICTGIRYSGNCITYALKGSKTLLTPEVGHIKYPMPLYQPVNIPDRAKVVKTVSDGGNSITEFEEEDGGIEFAQKIKSFHIADGDSCLVVFFENKIEDWGAGAIAKGPGPHSQAFTTSETNLSKYEVGDCGSLFRTIVGIWEDKPCAQSIAVFPIKKIQE